LLLNLSDREACDIREALEDAAELDCLELSQLSACAPWLKENRRQVSAVFVGGNSGPALFSVIHLLRWYECSRPALIFRISDDGSDPGQALQDLGEAVGSILIKPVTAAAIIEKVKAFPPTSKNAGKNAALVFCDSPQASEADRRMLRAGLADCGFYKFFEVPDVGDAIDCLRDKMDQIGIVVCDWEMPSLAGARFLRRFYSAPRPYDLGLLLVCSVSSIDQIRAIQLAAPEITGYFAREEGLEALRQRVLGCVSRIAKQQRAESFLREARLFISRGRFEHADEILIHATKTLPDVATLYEGLGNVLRSGADRHDGAECLRRAALAYESALRLEPMKSRWALKCLELYVMIGKPEEGLRVARQHLLRYGFDDSLRARLAQLYIENGDLYAARMELRRALSVNPANQDIAALLERVDTLHKTPVA